MSSRANEWNEVADAVAGLGLKLKLHFEQAAAEPANEVNNALDCLGDAVDKAFDTLRAAVHDPAVQEDVRDVATRLRDALTNTLADFNLPATSTSSPEGKAPRDSTSATPE